ncbi:hypothetical protein LOTGIDRAFT_108245 [Lottia gigantea]|uniref:Uncharacterized protein n=1 Tax=Lottia gigantea TaxID=225164 RepID=V3Z0Z8_LOTGI|nr:hypothetical protein LOTGIDRAFT_108245 [Lottia gigantea]ESO84203.1 hypothetical protein LOTGIDRAFT_108245 [Lottia gigantea]
MAVSIGGVISLVVFYLLILAFGIWAAWRNKRGKKADSEDTMLAGRSIGLFVGVFTMTATWVGGGYINGSAEIVADYGLWWCQAPVGYALSLCLGGLFFASEMRTKEYVTMLDPFQRKYGEVMAAFLSIPPLLGEILYSAAILNALGGSLSVILELDSKIAVIVSAAVALLYTLVGGLYSVAYTDVIQLICIFLGLWLSVPFALTHDAVESISINATSVWIEPVEASQSGIYMDSFLLLIFGGIPLQVYFQRVLSARSVHIARCFSFAGALGCCIMIIPPILIGAVGATADWNKTEYQFPDTIKENSHIILPLVLKYLCPDWVGIIALGAVSAAVMSSTDSSFLSASSMFARNVFGDLFTKFPREAVILWVMRGAQVVVATTAAALAIEIQSVYYLYYLCSDLVYVILFPQLTLVIYFQYSNTYGSIMGFILGFVFRILGGEPTLGLQPVLEYPWYDPEAGQLFPFKTLSMLISLVTIMLVSLFTHCLFVKCDLSRKFDIFKCFEENGDFSYTFPEGKDNPVFDGGSKNSIVEKYELKPQ